MKAKPYVGVTGLVGANEVVETIDCFSRAGMSMNSSHVPMIGFLASYKTLNGQATTNKRYPSFEYISYLASLVKNDDALPMIHYNSREIRTLSEQISEIFDGLYKPNLCRALQLNIPWPDVDEVRKIKNEFPELKIVFQASNAAIEGKKHYEVVSGLKMYGGSIDYILLDPSAGQGIEFDIDSSVRLYELIDKCVSHATVGFAGGFTGKNVNERLRKLTSKLGNNGFCIDSEGGLRDKLTSEYGDDILNPIKVSDYIGNASRILKS